MISKIIKIVLHQTVVPHRSVSIIGIFLFLTIVFQIITGIMISFSFVCEPMLVPHVRDEEDMYDLYTDDFFWLHQRGVDLIFIFMYLHMFRKMYLRAFSYEQESTWKSGGISFLLIHGIIFFGLVLSCTHLSDVTLTIAANIVKTICLKYGKLYWILFTDQTLNTDTVIRLAYIHYILPFFLVYLGFLHAMDMHYGWKDSMFFSNTKISFFWFSEVLKNEFLCYANILLFFAVLCMYLYSDNEPLSFELFMWGDLGLVNDVRFLSVAPHWYFRAYMGWLILCPHHYIGIFGLLYFFICIYFQPNIQSSATNSISFLKNNSITVFEISFFHKLLFSFFIMSVMYAGSFLPYGRFYISVGGNFMSTLSYVYIYIYLSVPMIIFSKYTTSINRKQNLLSCTKN